jgi:tetratricopeptide (TPR) repeat protein
LRKFVKNYFGFDLIFYASVCLHQAAPVIQEISWHVSLASRSALEDPVASLSFAESSYIVIQQGGWLLKRVFMLLFLSAIFPLAMRGQEDTHQQFSRVLLFEQKGQYEQAIRISKSLIEANSSTSVEVGRAWTLLGVAYEEEGRYQQSRNAYEQAIRLLESDAQHLSQYAFALDSFASLNSITQSAETANKLWIKALQIHKQLGDHRAMAKEYTFLAGIDFQKKQVGSAKKHLKQAIGEAALMSKPSEDDSVFLSDTQAWLASMEGNSKAELAAYQHSLELRKHHGEDAPLTGWNYLFVGNAYANSKECQQAMTNIRQGIQILDRTVGQQNPQYLAGEIYYSKILDRCGMHEEATHLQVQAKQGMTDLFRQQCVNCTVSVASLR